MKTFKLLSMLLAATSLLLASCSIDNLSSNEIDDGEECLVSLAVQVPDIMNTKTRATPEEPPMELPEEPAEPGEPEEPTEPIIQPIVPGGATKITKLSYFVYNCIYVDAAEGVTSWEPTGISGTVDMNGPSTTTFNISLLKGANYRVVCWADSFGLLDNPNSPYSFNPETCELTMDFDGLESNREDLDAFYGVAVIDNAATGKTHSVTLTRPFAQLNIGTEKTNIEEFNITSLQTAIEVTCANTLNIKTDKLSGESTVRYALADAPTAYKFPYQPDTYTYLSLNYIPVSTITIPVKLNYVINDLELNRSLNVPVNRNFRTNVYGNLISASSEIKATIDPIFEHYHEDGDRDNNYEYDPTLTPLHEAGKYGGTFKLTEDLELLKPVIVKEDLIVDLNGYTVSTDAPENGKNVVFYVEYGNSLTIKGLGQVKAISDSAPNYAILVDHLSYWKPSIKIEGGSFTGDIATVKESDLTDLDIQISGGGFQNCDNPYLESYLIGNLKFIQLGDWKCVISEQVPTTPAVDGWIEDKADLHDAICAHYYDNYNHYLYTSDGVSYIVQNGSMTVYPSSCGYSLDLGYRPFSMSDGLSSVTIKEGILYIREHTFFYSYINRLTLPESLLKIEEYAFYHWGVSGGLEIPGGVTYISKGAFQDCSLDSVNVKEGVKVIEESAFEDNGSLKGIQFAESVNEFRARCLANCGSLETVIIRAESFEADASMFDGSNSDLTLYVDPDMLEEATEFFENITVKSIEDLDESILEKPQPFV